MKAATATAIWFAGLGLALAALVGLAQNTTVDSTNPEGIAIAVLWLLSIALLGYLIVISTLALLARVLRSATVFRASVAITPASWTSLNRWIAGPVIAATLAIPTAASASAGPDQTEVPVLRHIIDEPQTSTTTTAPQPQTQTPTPTTSAAADWTIEAGENLWTIAEAHLSNELSRSPTEAELTKYWRALVNVNADILANPSNPDLVYAGQVLELPDIKGH
jgi:hypothetical protein